MKWVSIVSRPVRLRLDRMDHTKETKTGRLLTNTAVWTTLGETRCMTAEDETLLTSMPPKYNGKMYRSELRTQDRQ